MYQPVPNIFIVVDENSLNPFETEALPNTTNSSMFPIFFFNTS